VKRFVKRLWGPRSVPAKLLVVTLVALFANMPLYAICAPDGCGIGPCIYSELLYDTNFENNCPQWVYSFAQNACLNGDCYAELWGTSAYVKQTVAVPVHTQSEIGFQFSMANNQNPGTERMTVEILSGSTVIDTVAVFRASISQGGWYSYPLDLSAYEGQNITVRFRRSIALFGNDGGTDFRITAAYVWVYYV
jgi:hypothetical protein